MGSGNELQIHKEDEEASSWLTCVANVPLGIKSLDKEYSSHLHDNPSTIDNRNNDNTSPEIVEIGFISSKDILLLLRTDSCLEMLRFQARSQISSDTIESLGIYPISQIYTRIGVFDSPKEPLQMFACGASNHIDVWTIKAESPTKSNLKLFKISQISKHTDICRDLLVIDNRQFSVMISCGLDGNVLVFDAATLNLKGKRQGLNVFVGGDHFCVSVFCADVYLFPDE